jgi:RNA polymerase sigma-70 factor, ECF subfamily
VDSDQSLVQQSASGRREAFDELVVRYRRRVYNLVRALTGGDSDAEDLVQDVFIRAYRAIGSFRGDSAFRSWLYRIAINVAHTHLDRRRVRDTVLVPPSDDGVPVEGTAAGEGVEETLLKRQIIDRALAELPEELRVLVVLRDVQGLKYEEIAEVVKTPRGTVESRLFRARQRLRPMLASLIVARPSDVDSVSERDVVPEGNGCATAVTADEDDP